MESGNLVQALLMQAGAVLVLVGMVGFAVWISVAERKAFAKQVQSHSDNLVS